MCGLNGEVTPTPENCIFPPLLPFAPTQVGTDRLSELPSCTSPVCRALLSYGTLSPTAALGCHTWSQGTYKTCAYFLWKPKPVSPETKRNNTQPAEQLSRPDCPAGQCQLAQFTAQHKASSMRTNAPHTHTRPSCKHPECTKRKSDEDAHQEHLTQPQELEPDFSFRHVKPTGAQTIAQGRPDAGAVGARQTRVLQHTPSAIGCSWRRPGGRAGQHGSSSETLRRSLAGSSPLPS